MDAVAVVRDSRLDNWTPATSFQGRSSNKVLVAAEAKKKDDAAAVVGAANMAAAAEAKKKDAAAVAGAGAGNKSTVAEAGNMVAEADKKKKKMVRVNQAYIDGILEKYPFKPFPCDPEEIEKTIPNPKTRELLRSMTASVAATLKACRNKDEAIIKQYYAKGYAEEEVEDSDDDDDAA